MKKTFQLIALVCLLALGAGAQNLATVSASNITDYNQQKLAAGQICFQATDTSDQPISFQVGGGGQALRRPYCGGVVNGAVSPAFTVPNPALTSPANILYRITVKDSSSGLEVLRYTQVAFTGTTFNFDGYAPLNLGSFAPLVGTAVTGNLVVTGNISATGTVTGSNIPANILQTVKNSGSPLTQRTSINFTSGLKCVDNGGTTTTDCSLTVPVQVNTVTFSATPSFDCLLGSVQKITLTGNVTSSSVANCQPGMGVAYEICQDATGGRTFVPPAGLQQWSAIQSTLSVCTVQQYTFDTTTNAYPDMMPALSGDVTNTAGSTVMALSTTGVVAGTCGQVVVDAKGRATTCTTLTDGTHGGTGVSSTATYPASGTVLNDTNSVTVTNKTIDCNTGNTCTGIAEYEFTAAYCNNATPSTGWDLFTSGAASAACITGTNQQEGVLNYANSGTPDARVTFTIPQNLVTSSTTDLYLFWKTATVSGTATFNVDAICVANNATDDPAFSAANYWNPAAFTASASANFLNISSATGISLPASCTAGTLAHLRIKRTDTVGTAVTASVIKLRILFKVNKT